MGSDTRHSGTTALAVSSPKGPPAEQIYTGRLHQDPGVVRGRPGCGRDRGRQAAGFTVPWSRGGEGLWEMSLLPAVGPVDTKS